MREWSRLSWIVAILTVLALGWDIMAMTSDFPMVSDSVQKMASRWPLVAFALGWLAGRERWEEWAKEHPVAAAWVMLAIGHVLWPVR